MTPVLQTSASPLQLAPFLPLHISSLLLPVSRLQLTLLSSFKRLSSLVPYLHDQYTLSFLYASLRILSYSCLLVTCSLTLLTTTPFTKLYLFLSNTDFVFTCLSLLFSLHCFFASSLVPIIPHPLIPERPRQMMKFF